MVRDTRWHDLERWSPTLFLVGGGLVVGHAAVRGIEAFTTLAPPPDVFAPLGYLVALIGLLALTPTLAVHTPRLARIAAVVASIPLVGWIVLSALSIGQFVGLVGSEAGPTGVLFGIHFLMAILTYGLFAIACHRAGVHSSRIGHLLIGPPVLMILLMAGAMFVGNVAIGAFVIGSGQAAVHVAIGAALRIEGHDGSRTQIGDAIAG